MVTRQMSPSCVLMQVAFLKDQPAASAALWILWMGPATLDLPSLTVALPGSTMSKAWQSRGKGEGIRGRLGTGGHPPLPMVPVKGGEMDLGPKVFVCADGGPCNFPESALYMGSRRPESTGL